MHEELKKELENIRKLDSIYRRAQSICDPVDYIKRHQSLLYAVCEYLLIPLREAEEEVKRMSDG